MKKYKVLFKIGSKKLSISACGNNEAEAKSNVLKMVEFKKFTVTEGLKENYSDFERRMNNSKNIFNDIFNGKNNR